MTMTAAHHVRWLNDSPGGQLAKRHGISWLSEPRQPIVVALEGGDPPEFDFKISAELVVDFYGGTVVDNVARFLCPPLLADELRWEEDEASHWSLGEPWDLELEAGDPVALVADDDSVLAVGTLGEDGIVEFGREEDAPST